MIRPTGGRPCKSGTSAPSNLTRNSKTDLKQISQLVARSMGPLCLAGATLGLLLLVVTSPALAERPQRHHHRIAAPARDPLGTSESSLHRQRLQQDEGARPVTKSSSYHQLTSQDLSSADQLDEPSYSSLDGAHFDRSSASVELGEPQTPSLLDVDQLGDSRPDQYLNFHHRRLHSPSGPGQRKAAVISGDNTEDSPDESMENSQDTANRNVFINNHKTQLRAMHDMFERRQLNSVNQNNHHGGGGGGGGSGPLQSSQELNPISIGLDPGSPFAMAPFQMGPNDGGPLPAAPMHLKPQMSNGDGLDGALGGPALPFGLNPLPHLLGFQSSNFEGPQRGDQSAHSNHHAAAAPQPDSELAGVGGGPKVWPKIFRFTDGRINLSDFEKQKKIRLSNKNQHGENHIESAPIIFDNRPLKRKSFLILHGGVFPGNR